MEKIVLAGKIYVISAPEECTITQTRNEQEYTLATIPAAGGQKPVTTIDTVLKLSSDNAIISGPFEYTPALDGNGDGGNIESDLNVGHAAADAVAAVCTLSLGDLAKGGTLTDSNGQSVELENPHKYAEGWVAMPDATAAGTIAFGEHEAIEFEASAAAKAVGWLKYERGGTQACYVGGKAVNPPQDVESQEAWTTVLAGADCSVECTSITSDVETVQVFIQALQSGTAGNDITLDADAGNEVSGPTLTGGVDARTPQEVLAALNASEHCPAVATLDAGEDAINFTAKEYGVNDTIVVTGSLFSDEMGMSGGHGDYTVAELVTAISGKFSDITPAAGEAEGTITLTATTAGKAANAITYTATGCFGSGITRQGSTTRGKDAVEQTDYKIYLNGEEFSGGGAPAAPVPEPLGTTTTLLHGHVYTLAVEADTDLSALGVEPYGTAELWIDYTAGSVTWPTGIWWAEGSAPTLAAGKSYAIALRNDGVKLRANVQYEDTTPAQS